MPEITPLEINPPGENPKTVTPRRWTPIWYAYPGETSPSVLAKWLARKTLKNLSVYSIVSFFCCEKLCFADTKACSLIRRSQLTNYCVMPEYASRGFWPKRHERHTQKFKSLHRRLSDLLGSTIANADRERRRARRHTYSPPPPAPYFEKVAADTKACSLITRSQLANYCV